MFSVEECILALKMDRNLSERTLALYKSRFRTVGRLTGTENLDFLKLQPEKVIKTILESDYAVSTQKALLGTLNAVSKSMCTVSKHNIYLEAFEAIRSLLDSIQKQNLCSQKQLVNWISLDTIREWIRDQSPDVSLLLLSLFAFMPARRATDYAVMKYVRSERSDPNFNYLVHENDEFRLVFNNYKTKTIYGTQTFKIEHPDLLALLKQVVPRLIANGPLLPKENFTYHKFFEIGSILTRCIRRNPDWRQKHLHPTLFRSIWATEQLSRNLSYAETEKLATRMGTSVAMLQLFYRKVNPPCKPSGGPSKP